MIEQENPHSPSPAEDISDRSQEDSHEPWHFPKRRRAFDLRVVVLTFLAAAIGLAAGSAAVALLKLIGLITNLSFYGRLSTSFVSPEGNQLGLLVVVVPVIGGVLVGLMAWYGSETIRGHGIPEVMLSVLRNQSRIPARVGVLKPISTAIAIGTGVPLVPRVRSLSPGERSALSSASSSRRLLKRGRSSSRRGPLPACLRLLEAQCQGFC